MSSYPCDGFASYIFSFTDEDAWNIVILIAGDAGRWILLIDTPNFYVPVWRVFLYQLFYGLVCICAIWTARQIKNT